MTAYEKRVETHNSQLANIRKTLAHRRLAEFLGEDAAKLLAYLERAYARLLNALDQFDSVMKAPYRLFDFPSDR